MGTEEEITCTFSGFSLSRDKEGNLEQNIHVDLQEIEKIPLDASFSEFRSIIMRLAWFEITRPDFIFEISQKTAS